MADKSPPIAALISVAAPGFGHFYAGAWSRGVGVMIGLYFGFSVCAMAGMFFFALFPALYALAAWDAYRMAKRFNEEATLAPAAPAPPSIPLLVFWSAGRCVWILALFAYGAVSALAGMLDAIVRQHSIPLALLCALPAAGVSWVVWLALRDTWRGLRRQGRHTAAGMRDEASATLFVCFIGALMLAICWPMFSQLIRVSGQGAMKGNLGGLRRAIDTYKKTHDGAAPPTLEAALDKTLPQVPFLWSSSSVGPHKRSSEVLVVSERTGTDSGKWGFVVSASSPELSGLVYIDCTHTDAKGSVWTSY